MFRRHPVMMTNVCRTSGCFSGRGNRWGVGAGCGVVLSDGHPLFHPSVRRVREDRSDRFIERPSLLPTFLLLSRPTAPTATPSVSRHPALSGRVMAERIDILSVTRPPCPRATVSETLMCPFLWNRDGPPHSTPKSNLEQPTLETKCSEIVFLH